MTDNPLSMRHDHLVRLLEEAVGIDVVPAAANALRRMDSAELPVGRSAARPFVELMRRKLKSASGAGYVFDGWRQLEASLLALDPATEIRGVALPDGGSIVLTADLARVLGALVRTEPRRLAEEE